MKKLILIVLVALFVSVPALFAQEVDTADPVWMTYVQGMVTYYKWSGKFFTDAELEKYIYVYKRADYDAKRQNEFQWKPYFTAAKEQMKERVAAVNLQKVYFNDFRMKVGEYDFDKKGFWGRIEDFDNQNLYYFLSPSDSVESEIDFRFGTAELTDEMYYADSDANMPISFFVMNALPNGYFFPMEPNEAEKLINEITPNNRMVCARIYFTIDAKTTKEKAYTEFMKKNSKNCVLPTKFFTAKILKNYKDPNTFDFVGDVTNIAILK